MHENRKAHGSHVVHGFTERGMHVFMDATEDQVKFRRRTTETTTLWETCNSPFYPNRVMQLTLYTSQFMQLILYTSHVMRHIITHVLQESSDKT